MALTYNVDESFTAGGNSSRIMSIASAFTTTGATKTIKIPAMKVRVIGAAFVTTPASAAVTLSVDNATPAGANDQGFLTPDTDGTLTVTRTGDTTSGAQFFVTLIGY